VTHDPAPLDVDAILAQLKDFQRASVEYVFKRLYLDEEPARRFLVADEVGLGKTLVARGVIAKAIQHLREKEIPRIDIVYICSNADIAWQNINRLQMPGQQSLALASRITLLPVTLKDLKSISIGNLMGVLGASSGRHDPGRRLRSGETLQSCPSTTRRRLHSALAAEELAGGLGPGPGELGQQLTATAEQRPKQPRDGEHHVAVGHGGEQLPRAAIRPTAAASSPMGSILAARK